MTKTPQSLAACLGTVLVSCLSLLTFATGSASAAACAGLPAPGSSCVIAGPQEGPGAGQVANPREIGVDQASGTVYVGDGNNRRIDAFDSAGNFLFAFGVGVATGAEELQKCTTSCAQGLLEPQFATEIPGAIDPAGLAVDQSSHDVYAFDGSGKQRVEKYGPEGQLLLMFGKNVDQGGGIPSHPGNVCTAEYILNGDKCGTGEKGSGPGEFSGTDPLAVDASGNVWVGDVNRLEEFSSEGAYLKEIALPSITSIITSLAIDTDPASSSFGDFYLSSASANEIQEFVPPASGTYTLSFEGETTPQLGPYDPKDVNGGLALGVQEIETALDKLPAIGQGNVRVGGHEEWTNAGHTEREELPPVKFEFGGKFVSRAVPQIVSSAGVVTTASVGGPGKVSKFSPSGALLQTLDEGGYPNAVTVDPGSGDLYVSDQALPLYTGRAQATLLEFGPSGTELEAFGSGEVIGEPEGNALAFGDGSGRLYVTSNGSIDESAVQMFAAPLPGPVVSVGALRASGVRKASAIFDATVNPEGHASSVHFEYLTEQAYVADGGVFGAGTTSTVESGSFGEDFEAHAVSQTVVGLLPGTKYRFRIVAKNEKGTAMGETGSFETLPPARVDSISAAEVSSSSATLMAEVNPLGDGTTYHFEYLSEAGFHADGESWSGPVQPVVVPQPEGFLGAGEADVSVAEHLQGLSPSTTYRYRIVAVNTAAPAGFAGPEQMFTTQAGGSSLSLPDGRAWELVSQVDKHGALLEPIGETGVIQAAASGDGIAYLATLPTEEDTKGYFFGIQVLSKREGGVWSSKDVALPHAVDVGFNAAYGYEYRAFSPELDTALVEPLGEYTSLAPESSPADTERTPYLRHDESCAESPTSCFEPLVTGASGEADVPGETKFGGKSFFQGAVNFEGASPDLQHVIVSSEVSLTETNTHGQTALYEWSAGLPAGERLQLVSWAPGNTTPAGGTPELGFDDKTVTGAVSEDGSRVVWSESAGEHHLYLRDVSKQKTIRVDAPETGCGACAGGTPDAVFQTASNNGSRILFTDTQALTSTSHAGGGNPDLYVCEVVEVGEELQCDLTDLTPGTTQEAADLQGAVLGASEDGAWVYYVADGALATGAPSGDCAGENSLAGATCGLYASHYNGTSWEAPRLVTVLSGDDYHDSYNGYDPGHHTARVSPNGLWVAFMSDRSLTGYDNRDAASGKPDEEVYLYDAKRGKLVCASCDPTGARPNGVEYKAMGSFTSGHDVWRESQWIAANVPGWDDYGAGVATYQSRYLSNEGRLFFNSSDALVSQDINGTEDVYEYEPEGVGPPDATCGPGLPSASGVFTAAHATQLEGHTVQTGAGCVGLISSGSSSGESAFLDASETGGDVFFLTGEKLVRSDIDTAYDIYDAHICGVEGGPCPVVSVPTPPCTTADACRAAPTPQPPIFGLPSSATFTGIGNQTPAAPAGVTPKTKTLTLAQKLAAALKACKKLHAKKRREACEKTARKRYVQTNQTKKSAVHGKRSK